MKNDDLLASFRFKSSSLTQNEEKATAAWSERPQNHNKYIQCAFLPQELLKLLTKVEVTEERRLPRFSWSAACRDWRGVDTYRPKIPSWFYNESGSKKSQGINGVWAQFSESYRFNVTTVVGKTMPPPQSPCSNLWNLWCLTPHGKQDLFDVVKVKPLNSEIILVY